MILAAVPHAQAPAGIRRRRGHAAVSAERRVKPPRTSAIIRRKLNPLTSYVYDSTESGISEAYVQSFPAGRGRWRVSNGGGSHAQWREDGKEILFRTATSLMAADVTMSSDRFIVGTPHLAFDYAGASVVNVSFESFDNGQRFLVPHPIKRPNLPLTVLLHWQNGLPR